MDKKSLIIFGIVIGLVLIVSCFWYSQNSKNKQESISSEQKKVEGNNKIKDENNSQLEKDIISDLNVKYNSDGSIDTSDWKIYTNEGWKYSIKYPSNLFIDTTVIGDGFPGDNCPNLCGNGGRSLVISDRKRTGNHVTSDDKVIIMVSTKKKSDNQILENYIVKSDEIEYLDLMVDDRRGLMRISKSKKFIGLTLDDDGWFYDIYGENLNKELLDSNYIIIKEILNSFNFNK